jgi:transcriptional regulator with XRE-family HTH domain
MRLSASKGSLAAQARTGNIAVDPPTFSRFGKYAKHLRESRGWSLEDLAQRFDSDRANIHRIEKGAARPRHNTVDRLAKALKATPDETIELFERAGYQPPIWPTSQADFDALLRQFEADWLVDTPPAILVIDVYWTIWYANATFGRLFVGTAPTQLIGTHYLTVCLDPSFGFRDALSKLADEQAIDDFLTVVLIRARRRIELGQGGARSEAELAHFKHLPGFSELWERAAPGRLVRGDMLTGLVRLRLRGGGCLLVATAPIVRDRRFRFVYFLPTDGPTARELAAVLNP